MAQLPLLQLKLLHRNSQGSWVTHPPWAALRGGDIAAGSPGELGTQSVWLRPLGRGASLLPCLLWLCSLHHPCAWPVPAPSSSRMSADHHWVERPMVSPHSLLRLQRCSQCPRQGPGTPRQWPKADHSSVVQPRTPTPAEGTPHSLDFVGGPLSPATDHWTLCSL